MTIFSGNKQKPILAALITALITISVYLPALQNAFVNWDDNEYVYDNPYIQSIDLSFFKWAFTSFHSSNWHPLTWISHAADYAVWGLDPMGHHLTSIILHGFNTFLVVLLVTCLVRVAYKEVESSKINVSLTAGIVTGLLFGLHPVHVESVAWVSERKDLLCAFFYLLSVISYLKYSMEHAGMTSKNYIFALLFFALALLSKPMAITLPLALIILDIYPLERLSIKNAFAAHRKILIEKIPFFGLSIASAIITIAAQQGSIHPLEMSPLGTRILVSFRALGFYLTKMVFPSELVPLYPLPAEGSFPAPDHIFALLIAAGIAISCIWAYRKKYNFWSAAWAYYLVTLLPVLGIIQVGKQAAADRYTYLPSLGPFILAGLAAAFLIKKYSVNRKYAALSLILAITMVSITLSGLTIRQTGFWKDAITLWNRELEVFPENHYAESFYIVYSNRGIALAESGAHKDALRDFRKAISINPQAEKVYYNIGFLFDSRLKDQSEALKYYNRAIELKPDFSKVYHSRAMLYKKTGKIPEAINDLEIMIAINNYDHMAYYNIGLIYDSNLSNYNMAIKYYTRAIELKPDLDTAYYNLGLIHDLRFNNFNEAIKYYTMAIEHNPAYFMAYNNRGIAYASTDRYREAIESFSSAIDLNDQDAKAYFNRGQAYTLTADHVRALEDFRRAAELGEKKAERYLIKKPLTVR